MILFYQRDYFFPTVHMISKELISERQAMKQLIKILAHPFTFLRHNFKSALCVIGGSFLLIFALFLFYNTPDRQFERLLDSFMVQELSSDGLTLHYTVAEPKHYNINNPSHTFAVFTPDSFDLSLRETSGFISLLDKTDPHLLSSVNRLTYTMLYDYLNLEIEGDKYRYYEEPLTFSSGMHVQLPILLSEYTFRTPEDIGNYFTLLSSLPQYLNGILTYERGKADNHLFMSRYALQKVLKQCSEVITKDALDTQSHLLQTSFISRLTPLLDEGIIDRDSYEKYIQDNNQILQEKVLPGYVLLTNGLLALQDFAGDSVGLLSHAKGDEYYCYLIRTGTGSDKSPEELMDLLKTSFLSDYEQLEALLPLSCENPSFTLNGLTPDEIIEDLCSKAKISFPLSVQDDTLRILPVEKSLQDYMSPAFYLTPPLDDYTSNVIYINEGDKPDDLTLYTTLAHEGYPGHLYQTTTFYQTISQNRNHPARALLHYPGYTEGYATYAEFLSFEYAKSYADPEYVEALCLYQRLHLALYSMLDICIHYYGYNNEETYECLSSFGIEDRKTAGEIYEYIVNSPATYLSYFVGYLEIMECRELAMVCWKDSYSDRNFHEFLLAVGPASFSLIKEQIRENQNTNFSLSH